MFEEDEQITEIAAKLTAQASDDNEQSARLHSRKPLPEHLDCRKQVLTPGEKCNTCGEALKAASEDVTEELDYVPGRSDYSDYAKFNASKCRKRFHPWRNFPEQPHR